MEGVEASVDATEELACARCYAAGSSRMGGLIQRLLAYVRLAGTRPRPTQCPLAATRPARIRSELAPLAACLTNRRMRTRMSGGVGGVRETRAPTRFSGRLVDGDDAAHAGHPAGGERHREGKQQHEGRD